MANLPETPQWSDGVYQIETSDPVLGGPDGISNRQAKQLASRTSYLKQQLEQNENELKEHTEAKDPHPQYAPKASPVFKGTPTAPTPAQDANNTQIATTAFVQSLANAANNNANTRLEKNKNGADILDKQAFVKNLGLADAVKRAENAYPKTGGTITGHVDINAPYGALRLNAPDRNSDIFVEFGSGNNRDAFLGFGSRNTKTFTIHNDKTNARLQINEYATFNENKLMDMGDIASHTGSSPKTVMSQKSTTEAINRHASLGINQHWRDVTDNRRPSVEYKNNTDRPICLSVTYQELVIRDWYALMALNINGRDIAYSGTSMIAHEGTIESRAFVTGIIPPGARYSLSMYTNHTITSGNLRWYELS